jgi:hypothetical protein
MILIGQIRPVAYEPADLGKLAIIVHCRQCAPCYEHGEVHAIAEKLTRAHQQRFKALLRNIRKAIIEFSVAAYTEDLNLGAY